MTTRALLAIVACVALLPGLEPATADAPPSSRVIVSTTLNSTLQFFDAESLEQTQPPLVSKGLGPVRLWVQRYGGKAFLLAANHGAVLGSVGAFDLGADPVTELPLSPFPARSGSVGIAAAETAGGGLLVGVTNTTFALGGCDMPTGTATLYDGSNLASLGVLLETATVELTGPIPYAIAIDGAGERAYASTNCGNTLDTIDLAGTPARTASRGTGDGPDATLWDDARSLVYTVNIGGDSVSVHDPGSPDARTTVPIPGSGPIDATVGSSPAGRDWLITSNGQDDSISVIDRDVLADCAALELAACDAEVARIGTGVPGGAPEGVAYDPVTDRVFVVNKTILAPSLSVIQLNADGTGTPLPETIPLNALGADVPIPAIIAFDVVVQTR